MANQPECLQREDVDLRSKVERAGTVHHSGYPWVSLIWRLSASALVIGCFFGVAYFYGLQVERQYVLLLVVTFLASSQLFSDVKFDRDRRSAIISSVGVIIYRWFLLCAFLTMLGFISKMSADFSRKALLTWMLVAPFALIFFQLFFLITLRRLSDMDTTRRVIVVGKGELGQKLIHALESEPNKSVECVAFFDDRNRSRGDDAALPLKGKLRDVTEFVRNQDIDLIYIALPMIATPRLLTLLNDLSDTTASIYFVPDIFAFDLIQSRLDNINGIPVIAICESPFEGQNGAAKRIVDFCLSLTILLLISPLMLFIALGVKLSSPGPVIFKQRRYGLNGKEIVVYKFRTMTVCEDDGNIEQARKSDKRVTRFGAFLRKTSLDELPQFINVLQGRMSIVGPRPHAVAHNEHYRKKVMRYMIRHKVKPGITGLAQVQGCRGETASIELMQQRVKYDLEYLRNWSLSLDFWIILKSFPLIWSQKNAY
jgi:putative colanic acid biosynthesis UDP-glucose lipid carrier transferase